MEVKVFKVFVEVGDVWELNGELYCDLLSWGVWVYEIGLDIVYYYYYKYGVYLIEYFDLVGFLC